jgi:TATA-box binding protein (TBP) (component of TFIID and TFIIIB)
METLSISQYRKYLRENQIDQYEGDTAAYLDLIESISLGALTLGLGLEDIKYNPNEFPAGHCLV